VRKVSLEISNVAEVELFPAGEDSMCIVDMRDGDAPSGSTTASCVKGYLRDPGGATGSTGLVIGGGLAQGRTGVPVRAEVGSRTDP